MAVWFAGILGLLAAVLLARLIWEWRRYARGGHVITQRQLYLRIASAADLIVLLGLIAAGVQIDFSTPEQAFAYWGICLALALVAMVLALWDLALLRRNYGRRRAESYRRLSNYLRRLTERQEHQVPRP